MHHVSINLDDVETAIAFHCGTLGLEQRTDRPDFGSRGAWFDARRRPESRAQPVVLDGGEEPLVEPPQLVGALGPELPFR